jgi:hypothetical protein
MLSSILHDVCKLVDNVRRQDGEYIDYQMALGEDHCTMIVYERLNLHARPMLISNTQCTKATFIADPIHS